MNPCPCGFLGDTLRECRCTPQQIARYHDRLSGPLRDRLDLIVDVPALPPDVLTMARRRASSRRLCASAWSRARDRQGERYARARHPHERRADAVADGATLRARSRRARVCFKARSRGSASARAATTASATSRGRLPISTAPTTLRRSSRRGTPVQADVAFELFSRLHPLTSQEATTVPMSADEARRVIRAQWRRSRRARGSASLDSRAAAPLRHPRCRRHTGGRRRAGRPRHRRAQVDLAGRTWKRCCGIP